MQIKHLEGSRKGEVDSIYESPAYIGSQKGVEIFFSPQKEPKIAKVHGKIDQIHGKWVIEDLGSKTGIFLNQKQVAMAILHDQDKVGLGENGPVFEISIFSAPPQPTNLAPSVSGKGKNQKDFPLPNRKFSNDEIAIMQDILQSLSWRIKLLYTLVFALLFLLLWLTYFQVPFFQGNLQKKKDSLAIKKLQSYFQNQFSQRKGLQEKYEKEIQTLKAELLRLKKRKGEEKRILVLENRLSSLAKEIRYGENLSQTFKKIQQKYEKATGFIYMEVMVMNPKTGVTQKIDSFGTGFFLTPKGDFITNKHVIQPWKFGKFAEKIGRYGLVVLQDTQKISLWRSGTPFLTKEGKLDYSKGYNNFLLGNLQVLKIAPDTMKRYRIEEKGKKFFYWAHLPDNQDLALLKIRDDHSIPFVRLGSAQNLEKLDSIMVLGYPRGMDIMERGVIQASPTLGTIRKVEDTIYVSASIIPGNSGGPIFNQEGKVAGICTRVYQKTETLGVCIKSQYIWNFLPPKIRKMSIFSDFWSSQKTSYHK